MEADASRMGGAEAGRGVDELWYWSAGKRGVVATALHATFLISRPIVVSRHNN
jgi:hypothetical protein